MKVLLAFYGDETRREGRTVEDYRRVIGAWREFEDAAREAGVYVAVEALESTPSATTVRIDGDRRRVIDGPFVETKEQLGGFALLEVADLDEAMEWAARTPWNHDGCVTEIRPVMNYEAMVAAS
ncbi:MAG TPA: YciI family protein [Solirubrobacter sp.]|nr:YciI family protein [Solirubrobacter sp.]